MPNRNLIILRTGDRSLHPNWLPNGTQSRTWDLALSYYGRNENPYPGTYDLLSRQPGSKWEGLTQFLRDNPDLLRRYDYFWFPDDDLLTNCGTIDRMFRLAQTYDLQVSQPALSLSSHISHAITLQRPKSIVRETTFVEVMAPLFSRAALSVVSPTFANSKSGWGLEWLWLQQARSHSFRVGIIDAAAIQHTRPVGSAGNGGADSPFQDMENLFRDYGIQREEPRTLKAHLASRRYYLFPEWLLLRLNKLICC